MQSVIEQAVKKTVADIEVKVNDIIQRSHNVKSIRFAIDDWVGFTPGQYVILTLKGDRKLSRALSISSSPTDYGYIEVTKRLTDSDFSNEFDNLKVGDNVKVRYPMGKFTFSGELPKVAFLSGGIGITPIRSICGYIHAKNIQTDMALIYANNTSADRAFIENFCDIKNSNKNFRFIEVINQPDENYTGHKGFITAEIIKQEIPDYKDRTFFICGPQSMVTAMRNMLSYDLKMPEDKIVFENFTGY